MPPAEGPWFILCAGVNGSGESTFANKDTLDRLLDESNYAAIEVINPDTEAQQIRAENPAATVDEANRLAAERCELKVRDRIASGNGSFAIETVLSTDKYRSIVLEARRLGWRFLFIYIAIDSVEESIRRVAHRVAHGGQSAGP